MPEVLAGLVTAWLSAAPGLVGPVYPWLNGTHVFSLGLLIGSVVVLDLRLLGTFRASAVEHLATPLGRVAGIGLAVALVSGAMLFSVQPGHYLDNPAFLAKLGLVAFGLANAGLARTRPSWRRAMRGEPIAGTLRLSAALSLVTWTAAVFAGRWIAYL